MSKPSNKAADAKRRLETMRKLRTGVDKLLPKLAEREAEARQQRCVPEQSVAEMKKLGLFRILQPAEHGGLELLPRDFHELDIRLAEACMSTSWIYGVIGVHPFQLALFDAKAQEEVWGDDPDTLMSSSYAPMGKVKKVDGGFSFSGRWGWSSGCDHCQWALLGGIVPEEGYRTFLVPRSDYEIDDTWHVMGLQGTGSKDIVIENAFVPEHRTHRQMDGFAGSNPGDGLYEAPMFQIPWGQIFVRAVSSAPIGALKRMLTLFIERAGGGKSSSDPSKSGGDAGIHSLAAEVSSTINELEAVLYANADMMMSHVEAGEEIPIGERIRCRYQSSIVVDRCIDAANKLFSFAGGRSVFLGQDMLNIFLDIRISRAHVANNPVPFGRNYGATLFGLENNDFFL